MTRLTDTTRSEVTLYTYDERDRLLSARGPLTESYAYNAVGNLLALTPTVGTAARYTYGLSQTVVLTAHVPPTLTHRAFLPLLARYWAPGPAYPPAPAYPTTGQPFAVLSTTAGFRATYDANGNMTQRVEVSGTQRITYTQEWDAEHRLTVVTATVGGVTRFSYDGDGARVQQVNANGTTLYLGAVELFITGTTRITKTYYALGSQPVALRVVSATTNTVYWLHGDALGSLVLVTASAGPGTAQRYTPYGTLRMGGGLPTDLGFTGQRADGTGLLFYQARYYSPGLGRFIAADTIVPEPGNPQSLNRYAYVLGNPLKYVDRTGHIQNDPAELQRAEDILNTLANDYNINIREDWGWRWVFGWKWNAGSWELDEMETLLQAVTDLANTMGGTQNFRQNLQGVRVHRKNMSNLGEADTHDVWLRSTSRGGFNKWVVVHELGHAWDAVNGGDRSKDMQQAIGAGFDHPIRHWFDPNNPVYWYDPGQGPPPCGIDQNFNEKEDFAEAVAASVYPLEAQQAASARGWPYVDPARGYNYADFLATPRGQFIIALMVTPP